MAGRLNRGDFIWLDFSPHSGREQAGRRPALVVSPADYNEISNCILVCPITSNRGEWPWKVRLPEGSPVGGVILVDQLRSVDARARFVEPSGHRASPEIVGEVLARLATLTG